MIEIRNLTKSYRIDGGRHYVFRDVSAVFPENANIGIIGPNGGGKSTFLRLLGGIDHPDSGRIISNKTFSWPLALKGGFVNHLSGRENCRMVCNLYGLSSRLISRKLEEIKELSGIGKYFEEPVKYYSSGMGGRLGFALSMSFDFDYFLIDEITSVGDAQFKALAKKTLEEKAKKSRVIMVSHSMGDLKKFCDVAVLVSNGQFRVFDNLDEAIRAYLPQGKDTPNASKENIHQASIEELKLDSVKLPDTTASLLSEVETNLASIQQKLANPSHLLPRNETAFFFQLASLYEGLGQTIKARDCYRRAANHNPYHLSTQLALAELALELDDHDTVETALKAAELIRPLHPKLLLCRMRQHLKAGRLTAALETNDIALSATPTHYLFWHLRAQILSAQNLPDQAISAQTTAIRHSPKRSGQYRFLASLFAQTGDIKTFLLAAHKASLLAGDNARRPPGVTLPRLSRLSSKLNRTINV